MGKNRKYIAYICVSCSGPENGMKIRIRGVSFRTRNGADLKHTTADSDWFYSHVQEDAYTEGCQTKHFRLVNPSIREFASTLEDAVSFLMTFSNKPNWDGGAIVLIYAGHGQKNTGAFVFTKRCLSLEARDFVAFLANKIPNSRHRLRIDALIDSCHSGGFIANLLWSAHNEHNDKIFPCTLFASSLPDEVALEADKFRHGVFTYSYMEGYRMPSLALALALAQAKWKLIPKMWLYQFFGRNKRRLIEGGVSFLTDKRQHSIEYENGYLEVHNHGAFRIESENYEFETIIDAMEKARYMDRHEEFSI